MFGIFHHDKEFLITFKKNEIEDYTFAAHPSARVRIITLGSQ